MPTLDELLRNATENLKKQQNGKSAAQKQQITLDAGELPEIRHEATSIISTEPPKSDYFEFKPTKHSKELEETLKILSKRSAIDAKQHYRNIKIGKRVQLGTIVGQKSRAMHSLLLGDESIKRRVDKVEAERNNVTRKKRFGKKRK